MVVSAALTRDGTARRALHLMQNCGTIALSDEVVAEIAEVLARPKFRGVLDAATRADAMQSVTDGARWFRPTTRVTDCRDPKDDKYLELALALAAGADAIVTEDADLLALDPWCGVRILTPAGFLAAYGPG